MNEYGSPLTVTKGKTTEQLQYDYHYLTAHSINKGNTVIEGKAFQFDRVKGLLNHRTYSFNGDKETFGYDNLERLTSWTETGKPTQTQEYDIRGRIERNNQIGRYRYEGNGYQQTRLNTNQAGDAYYTQYAIPMVTYNAFKSPVEIKVDSPISKDIISYQYDAFGSRATAYYGGTQADRNQRRFQKHYSHDGVFEVRFDRVGQILSFNIYLGGDAYSAPVVYCTTYLEDTGKYLYLHRDYLGSITLITDDEGNPVERRHFNAWGQLTKYWNAQEQTTPPAEGILLDRGYTSHEHLLSVGLIHMNGRLYDPVLHRFLQPDNYVQDPFNTQNFNRYGYVLNNPLKYTDPSGEIVWAPIIIGAIIGAYTAGVAANDGEYNLFKWNYADNWDKILGGALIGAINGALAQIPGLQIPIGNSGFGIGISPQIALGSDGLSFGFNSTFGYKVKGFNFGLNLGASYSLSEQGTGNSGFDFRLGYGIDYKSKGFQAGIGSTYFVSGETSQQTGLIYAGGGNWKLSYENDTWAPVPGLLSPGTHERDKYRTAGLRFDITGGKYKGANAGMLIFTGKAKEISNNTYEGGNVDNYRMGVLYAGYKGARVGYNSERNVRAPIQNGFHNLFGAPHFRRLNLSDKIYYGYYSSNPYTLW